MTDTGIEAESDQESEPANLVGRILANGWLLAAVWLVFLIFPVITILAADDIGSTIKAAAVALIVAFAGIYIHGFQILARGESETVRFDDRHHFVALGAITIVLYLLVGIPSVGVIPFVVAFGCFHFSWPMAWAATVGGTAVVVVIARAGDALDDVWFMAVMTAAIGAAAMLIRLFEGHEIEQTALRTSLAVSDERNRVARDVHDVLGHSLTAVILKAELCRRLLDGIDADDERTRAQVDACRQQLDELHSVSRSALAEIRSTVGGLRVADLADEVTVARTVLADADVALLVTGDAADVPAEHRATLAWVVREAVTNVVRHARADTCRIELTPGDGATLLRVSDDGVGRNGAGDGNGLRGIRERVEAVGGQLRIDSGPDGGTIVEVSR